MFYTLVLHSKYSDTGLGLVEICTVLLSFIAHKPSPLIIIGEQVAVFRGHDGKPYVVDAYCPHLGANLAVGGRVFGKCIECPFHGWQFQGDDGKCVKIPYSEKGKSVTCNTCVSYVK